jgi:hypothetical protein
MTAKSVLFTGKIETRAQLAQVFHAFRESNHITFNQARAAVDSLACYMPAELMIEQRTLKSVITCHMPAGTVEINNRAKVRQILID